MFIETLNLYAIQNVTVYQALLILRSKPGAHFLSLSMRLASIKLFKKVTKTKACDLHCF